MSANLNQMDDNEPAGITGFYLVDEIKNSSKDFLDYFLMRLSEVVVMTNAECGFADEKFVAAIDAMFADPESVLKLSVEHRMALTIAYRASKAKWEREHHSSQTAEDEAKVKVAA